MNALEKLIDFYGCMDVGGSGGMVEAARKEQAELARQALCIMVLDLEYDDLLPPTHGHCPIRHLLLWEYCRKALGDEFDAEVVKLRESKATDNQTCKTNPQLTQYVEIFGEAPSPASR
jgi:hypothetical protein